MSGVSAPLQFNGGVMSYNKKVGSSKPYVDKKMCQYWHIKKRAKERLRLDLTKELYDKLVNMIKNNISDANIKIEFKEKQSNRLSVYSIALTGYGKFNIIYDKTRNSLVTILFEEKTRKIYHYIDVFGNKIPTSDLNGKFWKYDTENDDLTIECEEVIKKTHYTWEINNRLFELFDDGILYEKF
jgi:hypothetical protein